MEKQKAILDYIIKYSDSKAREKLGITSTAPVVYSKVLVIPSEEILRKSLFKIGKKYHTLIVLLGDTYRNYTSLDAYYSDRSQLEYLNNQEQRKRFVRYNKGVFTPITDADGLGIVTKYVLRSVGRLWYLKFKDAVRFPKAEPIGSAHYSQPINLMSNTPCQTCPRKLVCTHKERVQLHLKSMPDINALKWFEVQHPHVDVYLGRTEISSDSLERTYHFAEFESIVQYDLEITGLEVNEAGEYVPSEDKLLESMYEVMSYGDPQYLEDVIFKNASPYAEDCEDLDEDKHTLRDLIEHFKNSAVVENDISVEEATKLAEQLLELPEFQDLKKKYLG